MQIAHDFKPYTECPELCVAELDNGETCNGSRFDHTSSNRKDRNLMRVTKIRVENSYSDGHESTIEYNVNITGQPATHESAGDPLEGLWNLLWEYTGDGHGIETDLGWCHTITIVAADDPSLVGLSYETYGS